MNDQVEISLKEAIQLGAADGPFYARYFFPRTYRQPSAHFEAALWQDLDDPVNRYIAMKIFRGGAKTARLRVFTSRRIAYAISHSIVYTSNSEAHAVRSVSWVKRQIKYNERWATAFGLRQGAKWAENEIEIIHGVEEFPIRLVAVGITGQVRGFLSDDDFRPDLIVADDVDNEETTATVEQREKAQKLFFGALGKSLAPPTEAPSAKMALLQTPLAPGDTIDVCSKDATWLTREYSCFDADGNSTWEARFPTEFLKKEKAAHIFRNQLSMWMREMECKLVSEETASFRLTWLRTYDILPPGGWFAISIDPASADTPDADLYAMSLLYFHGAKVYLVEYFLARGVDPERAVNEVFQVIYRHRPRYIAVESIAYQRVLAWFLRRKMEEQRIYIPVREVQDKRKKWDRIIQAISDVAAYGNFYYKGESQREFVEQYVSYSPSWKGHDDLLDAIAIGLMTRNYYDVIEGEAEEVPELTSDEGIHDLEEFRGAP